MIWLGIFVFGLLFFYSVLFRIAVTHPASSFGYGFIDVFNFIRYNLLFWAPTGKLDCYAAHFGGGKTLSVVHYVLQYYKRYNDRIVYDRSFGAFVKQKVHILSNVDFSSVPFEHLDSLSQIVSHAEHGKELDKQNAERTVYLVVIDEASVQLNSRNFKSNIDPTFLNTLLTSRHYHISILYTSQKFSLTDKLMRDVTQRVIHCKKIWRFMIQYVYDADDLEYASNIQLVRPIKKTGYFIRNKDYKAYDTLAVVGNLQKSIKDGDMLSEAEILALRARDLHDDAIMHPSMRLKKRRESKKKRIG